MDFCPQVQLLITVVADSQNNASVVQAEKGYNRYGERNTHIILVVQVIGNESVETIPISTTILHNYRNIWGIEVIVVGHVYI